MFTESAPEPAYDTFTSADGDLAYRDTGSSGTGPDDAVPLVLLHSAFVDHTQFDALVPVLAGAGHRVIAPDARGHGYSANATRPFRQTDDLAALLRHLDLGGPAVLVGVSMGAGIAVEAALEHPDLVRALVVSGRGVGEPALADDPAARARHERQTKALAAGDIAAWLEDFVGWMPGPNRTMDDVDPAIVRHVKGMALRTLMKHAPDEPDHSVPVDDVATRAGSIGVPVLAVNGADDYPSVLRTATALIDAVPHGRSVSLPDAGHYVAMERPEEFARRVLEFVHEDVPGAAR